MRLAGEIVALIAALAILASAVGVSRLSIPLTRMHALTTASTVGMVLMAFAAVLALPTLNDATSALLAGGLQILTLPVAANLLARSAHRADRRRKAPLARWRPARRGRADHQG